MFSERKIKTTRAIWTTELLTSGSRREAHSKLAKTLKIFLDTEMLYWPSLVPLFCWNIVTVSPTLTPLSLTKLSHSPVITGFGYPPERRDSLKLHGLPRVSIAWNSIWFEPSGTRKKCRQLTGMLSLFSKSVRDKLFEKILNGGSAVVTERE